VCGHHRRGHSHQKHGKHRNEATEHEHNICASREQVQCPFGQPKWMTRLPRLGRRRRPVIAEVARPGTDREGAVRPKSDQCPGCASEDELTAGADWPIGSAVADADTAIWA
jgi:hypothetical protein